MARAMVDRTERFETLRVARRSRPVRWATLLLGLSLAFSLSPAIPQRTLAVAGNALAFDGASQYVTFGPASGLDTPTFTLETWVKWTGGGIGTSTGFGGIGNAIPLITKGRAESDAPANLNMNYFLGIDATSGKLVGDFEDTADGTNHPVSGNTPLTTNTWHHAAATYDGTTWRLYLDGVLDKTLVVGNVTPEASSIQHGALGTALTSTGAAAGFFAGTLDEARIWSVARTGSQIRSARDDEISGPQAGLLGRWSLNEGSGTIAANSAGGLDGSLVGSPTWIAGFDFPQDTTAPASPTNLVATAANGEARLTWTANSEPDLAGYNLYRSPTSPVDLTAAPINGSDLLRTTAYTDGGLVNGTTYHYALVAVDGADNRSPAVETTAVPGANGLPTVALDGPSNGATGTTTSPTLRVTATDPEGAALSVAFYGRTAASGIFTLIRTNLDVASGASTATTWPGRDDGQRYEWYVTARDEATTVTSSIWTFGTAPGSDPVLVGAGDIASCASSGDEATASILEGVSGAVFTLGDNAYENGLPTEFTNCYEPSWGRPGIKSRTRPASGNHDFGDATNNGDGYFDYFNGVGVADGPAGPRHTGIYSYDVGPTWHVVVLNSECGQVEVGCAVGSPQETWLRAELAAAADRGKNVIAIIHRPRFSSGSHGGNTGLAALWQDFCDYGVDLVLSGHDHDYERFAPMDGNGGADPVNGVREIVVGTGGANEPGQTSAQPNSLVRDFDTSGVLRLTLHTSSYDWKFLPVSGATFTDSGTAAVVGRSNSAPIIDIASIAPTSPATGQAVAATITAHDPDGDAMSYAYQWTMNGTAIAGATSSTLDLAVAGHGDKGDEIGVSVTASDGTATSAPFSAAAVTVVDSGPTATVALGPTSPATNDTLTATATTADADGDTVGLDYVWRNASTIVKTTSGSTSLTDTLDLSVAGNGDAGDTITVSVTPSDGTITGIAVTASVTVARDTTPPAPPRTPAINTTSSSIDITWPGNTEPDLAGYRVYRASASDGPYTLLTPSLLASSAYTDSGTMTGTIYYRVTAVDTAGNESTPTSASVIRSIAFRSATSAQNTGSSVTITRPAGVQSGDVLVAVIDVRGSASIAAAAGWTQVQTNISGTSLRQAMFVHSVTSADPTSYVWSFSSSIGSTGVIAAYIGVDTASPVDSFAGQANGGSTAIPAPSITIGVSETLLVTASGIATNATIAPATGMVEHAEAQLPSSKTGAATELADELRPVSGATGPRTATASKSAVNIGQAIALRPKGAPASPPPPATAPDAPQNLAATAAAGSVTLAWTAPVSDGGDAIANYAIYRGTASGAETPLAMSGTSTTYQDATVSNGTTYYYRVAARNSVGTGPQSNEASGTPSAASVPTAPRNFAAVPAKPQGVSVTWKPPSSDGGSAITGYRIFRGTAAGAETLLADVGNVTSYKDTLATSGVTYYYYVVAVNAIGAGPPSAEANAIAR